ncbi:tRNA(His) guanylyltransferase Thg1 family protein [Actinomadura sp. WMMB 499]|uniref:tRNA(His) guanylyltransferase Thg1 family protein n=1 Tax=Actinomadura sp. WMMB 499 TaxID=1219491 RepID=UPI0012488928|nr:tRNA(His) guanylyltransferase Thg1 family protein [Actinomadura sp. WMMB 499]QFG22393.1 tRNA 5'-guanylyltransferase [Actinomadura sp. WMMB 499]
MRNDDLETRMRERERFHALTLHPGAWAIVRVDGRSFSKYTETRFDKPFDPRFSALMAGAAEALLTELGGRYAYTESDEISVVLDPANELFGREVEKLVSLSAGITTAAFTHAAGEPAVFDGRVWTGTSLDDVVDYLSWRQADAARCALNGWCYWTLRKDGRSARQATRDMHRTSVSDKNELLFARGINFNDVPAWQRRGVGLWFETFEKAGHDPVADVPVTATRRRVRVERELPMRDAYRTFVRDLLVR